MSRNMCNLRHKVRNGQNLPHESLNFANYLFLKITVPTILAIFPQIWDHITKTILSKYFLFVFYLKLQDVL